MITLIFFFFFFVVLFRKDKSDGSGGLSFTTPTVSKIKQRFTKGKTKINPKDYKPSPVWKELMTNLENSLIPETMTYLNDKVQYNKETHESALTNILDKGARMSDKVFLDITVMFIYL